MAHSLVLTLIGHDKIGIVDSVTNLVMRSNGNIGASRMARLGGEFAMLLLIETPADRFECLRKDLISLREEGYIVNIVETEQDDAKKYTGWLPCQIEMTGADHEGVVHLITRYLAEHSINIESLETSVMKAPMSGTPLFAIKAVVVIPPGFTLPRLEQGLKKVGDELNMDTKVMPFTG